MIKKYFTAAVRQLFKNKVNSTINIAGLSVSIACCIFVYVFIKHEYSFDNFHSKKDRIYRVVLDDRKPNSDAYLGIVPLPMAKALRNDFPQLETVTQVYVNNKAVIGIPSENGSRKLFEDEQMTYADEYFFKTFDFKKLAGGTELLKQPGEVVLTKALVDKFYGKPVGGNYNVFINKPVTINKNTFTISAVLEDLPRNSNLACHLFISFKHFERGNTAMMDNWKELYSEAYTFVTLPAGYTVSQLDAALVGFKNKYLDPDFASHQTFHLQPLTEVHSDSKYGGTYYSTPAVLIIAFIVMGIIVLLTSCINFINLAVVQAFQRAKEVGIRKTLGSGKREVMLRFITETFLLIVLAAAIGLVLAHYALQAFSNYLLFIVELDLHIDYTILFFLISLCLLITVVAGYYPAKIMSSFKPVQALKAGIRAGNTGFSSGFSLRKALVVLQFTVSQILIIATIVAATQMKYFYSRDMGYQKEGMLIVDVPENNKQKLQQFRTQLMSIPAIREVSFSSGPPTSAGNGFSTLRKKEDAKNNDINTERKFVDPNFIAAYNIQLLAGRNLQASDSFSLNGGEQRYNVLLNNKAVQALGYKTPGDAIGKEIVVGDKETALIAGVTSDFFNVSLQQQISPCLLFYATNWVAVANIRMDNTAASKNLAAIESHWQTVFPDHIYKSMTLDYYLSHKGFYVIEDIMYQGFKVFVFIALIIGCLGLYGLVSFLALQRQKEIGIRKVLGSSSKDILALFSKEFAKMVLISFLIAAPLGYLAMKAWLDGFANRISLNGWYFVATLAISMLIATLTVGYRSLRAATVNPVKSLKTE
ncbi:MAG TPA: ABC transporter permease [Ferruginibacter sp.]|nr:ABC transporter permease [Ferruginibacter sp.]